MEVQSSQGLQGPQRSNPRRRVFTLEHANRTLPFVKRVVADIVKQHRKVCALEDKCHIRRPSVAREDHERTRDQYKAELEKLRWLADELSSVGCRLRDWQRGVIDFRSVYQGRDVELCWWLGQERVEYWHEVDEGFPGRRLIDDGVSADLIHSELVASGAEPVI